MRCAALRDDDREQPRRTAQPCSPEEQHKVRPPAIAPATEATHPILLRHHHSYPTNKGNITTHPDRILDSCLQTQPVCGHKRRTCCLEAPPSPPSQTIPLLPSSICPRGPNALVSPSAISPDRKLLEPAAAVASSSPPSSATVRRETSAPTLLPPPPVLLLLPTPLSASVLVEDDALDSDDPDER